MSILSGLIALALLGGDQPRAVECASIQFQIQVLDMEGLEWRGENHARLKPVTAKGLPSVWTAKANVAPQLQRSATRVYADFHIRCVPDVEASAFHGNDRLFVSRVNRVANGPLDESTAIAFEPDVDAVKDGVDVKVHGRPEVGGVRTRVVVEDTRFKAMHTVRFTEKVLAKDGPDTSVIAPQYQLPEIDRCRVQAECTIPVEDVLVLSLGVRTRTDANSKQDVICERLVVVSAKPDKPAEPEQGSLSRTSPRSNATVQKRHAQQPHVLIQAWRRAAGVEAQPTRMVPATTTPIAPAEITPIVPHAPADLALIPPPVPTAPPLPAAPAPSRHAGADSSPASTTEPVSPSVAAVAVALASPTTGMALPVLPVSAPEPAPAPPMPVPPSRSTPVAFNADGVEFELPPLPEDVSSLTDHDDSGHPNASSQSKHVRYESVAPRDGVKLASRPAGPPQPHCSKCGNPLRAPITEMPADDSDAGECDVEAVDDLRPIDEDAIVLSHVPAGFPHAPGAIVTDTEPSRRDELTPPSELLLAAPPQPEPVPPAELRTMTLAQAVRSALESSSLVRVLAANEGKPTFIVPATPVDSAPKFRSEVGALVHFVHRAYWTLKLQHDRVEIAHTAVALGEEALNYEESQSEPTECNRASLSAARETIGHWKLACVAAAENAVSAETGLRERLGISDSEHRKIIPVSFETSACAPLTWSECLRALSNTNPDVLEERKRLEEARALALLARQPDMVPREPDTDSPADAALTKAVSLVIPTVRDELAKQEATLLDVTRAEVRLLAFGYIAVQTRQTQLHGATEQTQKAWTGVEVTKILHRTGWVPLETYLESLRRWSNAARAESEVRNNYRIAVSGLARDCGSLLESQEVVVLDSMPPTVLPTRRVLPQPAGKLDAHAAHATHTERSATATQLRQRDAGEPPFTLRVPVGKQGFMEIRTFVKRTPAAARILSESPK